MKTLADLKDIEVDDLLGVLGLATRRAPLVSIASRAGIFVLGLLVGAGVALLFTPASGSDLRTRLKERIQERKRHERDGRVSEPQPNQSSAMS